MKRLGPILDATRPDLILVVGDGNAALAAALTAVKLGIPVVHLEAGLRSFDRTASGEINRLLTDAISDYLFATEQSGEQNLLREGISSEKIHLVGTSWWMPFGCSGPIGRARQYSTTWAWTPTLPGEISASRPGYAELEKVGEEVVGPGDAVAFLPDAIHSVVNETDKVTVSLHVYGKHLNCVNRSQFDPEKNIEAHCR